MNIAVLGAGAMGSLFGYKLKKDGHNVCLIDIWKDHVAAVNQHGLTIETPDGATDTIPIPMVEHPEEVPAVMKEPVELIIVFVKGTATDSAIRQAACIVSKDTKVITLQNGVGNADVLAKYIPANQVYFGTTTVGATIKSAGHVMYYPAQKETCTHIATMDGSVTAGIEAVASAFTKAGLTTIVSSETEALVWKKLVVNCIGNPMSVVTRLYSNVLCSDDDNTILTKQIIDEACAVAQKKGLPITPDQFDWVIPFTSKLERFPSMGYDAMNKMPTEIETINGAVVREGKRLGVPTPVNETLYHLVRLISAHYDKRVY